MIVKESNYNHDIAFKRDVDAKSLNENRSIYKAVKDIFHDKSDLAEYANDLIYDLDDPSEFFEYLDITEDEYTDMVYGEDPKGLLIDFEEFLKYTNREDLLNDILDGIEDFDESINEDVVKKANGKWTNRGDDGKEHGEFDTKKDAMKQMRAMYASGYKGESLEEDTWEDEHYKRWQKSDIDHVRKLLGSWVEITIDDYSLVVSIPKTEYINSGIINITGSFFETLKDYIEEKYEGYTLWSNNVNNYFHIVIDKKRNKTENLNEDVDIKTWNDAYAFFGDIVNKHFDGTPESIEKVNDEVTKLYLEHQGEEPFETAWKKWNDPYDGLDESLLNESDVEDPEIKNPHFNWLDNDTFVMTFDGGTDEDGDEFIYDAEYWKDKDSYHFIKVFDDDNMLANFSDDKKNEIIKMMQDKITELNKSSIK